MRQIAYVYNFIEVCQYGLKHDVRITTNASNSKYRIFI